MITSILGDIMSVNNEKREEKEASQESVKLSSAIGAGLKYSLYVLIIYYGLKWIGILGWLGIE